jgi:GTP-binding protein
MNGHMMQRECDNSGMDNTVEEYPQGRIHTGTRARVPVVAIVGRPNVGKSTLFNRLIGERKALVHDFPGVTRDRILGMSGWGAHAFVLMDTGGFEPRTSPGTLGSKVQAQIQVAIQDADVIVFVLDGREGLHGLDEEMADVLRKSGKPVVCVINKMDHPTKTTESSGFYRLGMEEVYPISAEHGLGINDLLDGLVAYLPEQTAKAQEEVDSDRIKVAVVGRANAGKSTFWNAILGEERHLVHHAPGTTRDAVDTPFSWKGREYLFIDTAGIRRKGKVREVLEKYSVVKALQGLDRCDVALLMVDACEGVTDQDAHIGGYILERGKALVVLVNKWDLVRRRYRTPKIYVELVRQRLHHLQFAPILTISAKTGYRVTESMVWVDRAYSEYMKRVPTGLLNRMFEESVRAHPPPARGNRIAKLYYITQTSVGPPTFVIFTNTQTELHFSYRRYLTNQIRERFGFEGAPIRLIFRRKR